MSFLKGTILKFRNGSGVEARTAEYLTVYLVPRGSNLNFYLIVNFIWDCGEFGCHIFVSFTRKIFIYILFPSPCTTCIELWEKWSGPGETIHTALGKCGTSSGGSLKGYQFPRLKSFIWEPRIWYWSTVRARVLCWRHPSLSDISLTSYTVLPLLFLGFSISYAWLLPLLFTG